MLKSLAILAMFLSITHAFVPTAGQAPNNDGGKSYPRHNETSSSQPQTNSVSPASPKAAPSSYPQTEPAKETTANAQDPISITEYRSVPNKRDWVDYATLGIGVVLALITGFGVAAAWIGLPEFRKQAEAAKDAAIAAKLSVRTFIASDRPWMLVKPIVYDIGKLHTFRVVVTNYGKSPALIVYTHFDSRLISSMDKSTEFYDPDREGIRFTHAEWVEPGGKNTIEGSHTENVRDPHGSEPAYNGALQGGSQRLWIWGSVRYQGSVRGDTEAEIYESRFCFMWTPVGQFVMGGPPGSNDYK